jgi:hypothetical protein
MTDTRHHPHRLAQTALAALAGVACLLLPAAVVRAGTFTALTCHDSGGNAIGTPGWSVGAANGQYITFGSSCSNGGQGSFGLTMGPDPTGEYYNGNGNTMTYSVPAGLTILDYSLNLLAYGGPCVVQSGQCANGFGQVFVNHTGQSDPNYDYRNLGYGAATTTVAASGLSGVSGVTVGVGCDPGQDLSYPCSGSADPEAQALVSGGAFTLLDSTVPAVSNVSGSLLAAGTLTGTDTIDFTGSDSGGGIYSAAVLVDGRVVVQEVPNNNGGLCVDLAAASSATMAFAAPQPCVSSENVSIALDTTQFAAGQHHLQVLVSDAAGDRAIAYDGTITTSGPPQVGVNGGVRGPHVANGEPCAGEELNVQVNHKKTPPVIAFGKPVTIRGVLHCGTVPIRHARVAIDAIGGESSATIDTSVQTALDGSFSYTLPRGPDRILQFSYTAYSDDPGPSATATAAITIRPRIRLRIAPHRASDGSTIHWTGTIGGGPYPHQGVGLVLEVKYGKGWRSFDQIVANRKGSFHYSYRFHATTEPTTYAFRVTLPDAGSAGYPYTPGASNQVGVRVTP